MGGQEEKWLTTCVIFIFSTLLTLAFLGDHHVITGWQVLGAGFLAFLFIPVLVAAAIVSWSKAPIREAIVGLSIGIGGLIVLFLVGIAISLAIGTPPAQIFH